MKQFYFSHRYTLKKLNNIKDPLHYNVWSAIRPMLICLHSIPDFKKDWSDHALWWPSRNKWLARPKHTLDQYGVHADAALHFTPMHKALRIQLPDLRYVDCKIDFSIDTFSAVIQLCKSLGKCALCIWCYDPSLL